MGAGLRTQSVTESWALLGARMVVSTAYRVRHAQLIPAVQHKAFVTFASPDAAASAKEACDRQLRLPGADRPLAHNGTFRFRADTPFWIGPRRAEVHAT